MKDHFRGNGYSFPWSPSWHVEAAARIPLWLVKVAARNASRFYTMQEGARVAIGVTSTGDMLAWHA